MSWRTEVSAAMASASPAAQPSRSPAAAILLNDPIFTTSPASSRLSSEGRGAPS